ncbi:unnamed protein product [Amoebophrya sp. A25]|nr:unnamed protein product [Amoebophrya sp. A25]|eukprot:GSA25T00026367001.1
MFPPQKMMNRIFVFCLCLLLNPASTCGKSPEKSTSSLLLSGDQDDQEEAMHDGNAVLIDGGLTAGSETDSDASDVDLEMGIPRHGMICRSGPTTPQSLRRSFAMGVMLFLSAALGDSGFSIPPNPNDAGLGEQGDDVGGLPLMSLSLSSNGMTMLDGERGIAGGTGFDNGGVNGQDGHGPRSNTHVQHHVKRGGAALRRTGATASSEDDTGAQALPLVLGKSEQHAVNSFGASPSFYTPPGGSPSPFYPESIGGAGSPLVGSSPMGSDDVFGNSMPEAAYAEEQRQALERQGNYEQRREAKEKVLDKQQTVESASRSKRTTRGSKRQPDESTEKMTSTSRASPDEDPAARKHEVEGRPGINQDSQENVNVKKENPSTSSAEQQVDGSKGQDDVVIDETSGSSPLEDTQHLSVDLLKSGTSSSTTKTRTSTSSSSSSTAAEGEPGAENNIADRLEPISGAPGAGEPFPPPAGGQGIFDQQQSRAPAAATNLEMGPCFPISSIRRLLGQSVAASMTGQKVLHALGHFEPLFLANPEDKQAFEDLKTTIQELQGFLLPLFEKIAARERRQSGEGGASSEEDDLFRLKMGYVGLFFGIFNPAFHAVGSSSLLVFFKEGDHQVPARKLSFLDTTRRSKAKPPLKVRSLLDLRELLEDSANQASKNDDSLCFRIDVDPGVLYNSESSAMILGATIMFSSVWLAFECRYRHLHGRLKKTTQFLFGNHVTDVTMNTAATTAAGLSASSLSGAAAAAAGGENSPTGSASGACSCLECIWLPCCHSDQHWCDDDGHLELSSALLERSIAKLDQSQQLVGSPLRFAQSTTATAVTGSFSARGSSARGSRSSSSAAAQADAQGAGVGNLALRGGGGHQVQNQPPYFSEGGATSSSEVEMTAQHMQQQAGEPSTGGLKRRRGQVATGTEGAFYQRLPTSGPTEASTLPHDHGSLPEPSPQHLFYANTQQGSSSSSGESGLQFFASPGAGTHHAGLLLRAPTPPPT